MKINLPISLINKYLDTMELNEQVASFYNDGKTIKVFAGNSDGSDDIELNYLDFINHYNYIVGKEFENPFMDIKI